MNKEAIQHVQELLQRGQKLEAIKHLRDTYSLTLEESKVLVETIEGKIDPSEVSIGKAAPDDALRLRLEKLLEEGKKIEAIKLAKETLRLKLKAAKTFVEEIERELGPRVGNKASVKSPAGILLAIFSGIGLVFVGVAAWLFISQQQSIADSDLVTGKVVRLVNQSNGSGSAPVIEYEWNNTKWLHASQIYTSPSAYSLDEEVSLFINKNDPSSITIDTFTDRWAGILIFSILGFVFLLVPRVTWLLIRKR